MAKRDLFSSFFVAGAIFVALTICAIIESIARPTHVTVRDTKNTVRIGANASLIFSGYRWEDDGKTLIITYEDADHEAD